jgi:hypothetical protein
MVDDLHISKGLPPVSASGQIQRVNRKKRDDEKPPFEKYLTADDKKNKKRKRTKMKSDTVDVKGKDENDQSSGDTDYSNSNDTAAAVDDSDPKIIDVRV